MLKNNSDYQAKKYEFTDYYQQKIVPALQPLENKRRKYFVTFMIICLFVIAWTAYVIVNFPLLFSYQSDSSDIITGLLPCALILILCFPMFSYFKQSKENLLPLIAEFFGQFDYIYQPKIDENTLKTSKIIKEYDKLTTDDSFNGQYDNVPVSITEYTRHRYQKNTKAGQPLIDKKIGHGIIFSADMPKKFTGQTIVVKDKGLLNRFAHYKNLSKVGLESTEFEAKYEVYSDSQIEARYILTPVMLEYMLALIDDFKQVEYSFFDNRLFMNIEIKKNYFEASNFFLPITNRKNIEKIFTELYLLFSIVETLKLNQQKLL